MPDQLEGEVAALSHSWQSHAKTDWAWQKVTPRAEIPLIRWSLYFLYDNFDTNNCSCLNKASRRESNPHWLKWHCWVVFNRTLSILLSCDGDFPVRSSLLRGWWCRCCTAPSCSKKPSKVSERCWSVVIEFSDGIAPALSVFVVYLALFGATDDNQDFEEDKEDNEKSEEKDCYY